MLTAFIVTVPFFNWFVPVYAFHCVCVCEFVWTRLTCVCVYESVCLLCSTDQFECTHLELVYSSGLHLFPFGCVSMLISLFSLRSESLWLAFFLSETRYHSDFGPFVSQTIQFPWYLMFPWFLDIYILIRSPSVGWKCNRSSLPLFNGLHSMTLQKNWPKCIWKMIRTRRMPTNGN